MKESRLQASIVQYAGLLGVLAVLVDHPEHRLGVLLVAGEGAHGGGHPSRLGVGLAVHEGGHRRGVLGK